MLNFPNAKINIGLYITQKRTDGFHNLESCFYPVPWTDGLEIIPACQTSFTTSGLPISGNTEDNLCVKTYRLLEKHFQLPPVHMHLHKVLPMGAGLGGGSSDAVSVIKLLDSLFDLNLSQEVQESFARELGSDCAFFVANKPVFAHQRGDILEPVSVDLSGYYLVIVHPAFTISTAEAYSRIKPKPAPHDLRQELTKPIKTWAASVTNHFEDALFPHYQALPDLKDKLYQEGALYASMSGSGSAIFGIFETQTNIDHILPANYLVWKGFL